MMYEVALNRISMPIQKSVRIVAQLFKEKALFRLLLLLGSVEVRCCCILLVGKQQCKPGLRRVSEREKERE